MTTCVQRPLGAKKHSLPNISFHCFSAFCLQLDTIAALAFFVIVGESPLPQHAHQKGHHIEEQRRKRQNQHGLRTTRAAEHNEFEAKQLVYTTSSKQVQLQVQFNGSFDMLEAWNT